MVLCSFRFHLCLGWWGKGTKISDVFSILSTVLWNLPQISTHISCQVYNTVIKYYFMPVDKCALIKDYLDVWYCYYWAVQLPRHVIHLNLDKAKRCKHISSVESQKGVITIIFNDVPLRTRRALLLYKVYGDSALLVLIVWSWNSVNALLVLSWPFCLVDILDAKQPSATTSSTHLCKIGLHLFNVIISLPTSMWFNSYSLKQIHCIEVWQLHRLLFAKLPITAFICDYSHEILYQRYVIA